MTNIKTNGKNKNMKNKTKLKLSLYILLATLAAISVISLTNSSITYKVKDAEASTITYENCGVNTKVCADGTLEWDLTNPEDYTRYVFTKAGLDAEYALRIAKCESGLNPWAIGVNTNGTIDRGYFQSNSIHRKTLSNEDAFDWKKNIDWTLNKVINDGGWGAWTCARKVK